MISRIAALTVSLAAALLAGYLVLPYFRKQKTGVSSPFIPDRKKLPEKARTAGGGFILLAGTLFGTAAALPAAQASERDLGGAVSFGALCVTLCLAGHTDDRLTDIKGQPAGLRPMMRILLTGFCGLLFSGIYLALGGNTVISLPFTAGSVRTGSLFCPIVTLLTAAFCEFSRAADVTDGVSSACGGISLFCAAGAAAFTAGQTGICFCLASAGAAAGLFFWNFPPALVKLGLSGKYLLAGSIIGCCILSDNERYIPFLLAVPMLSAAAFPTRKLILKLFGKPIFDRLPADAHLKSCGWSDKKIVGYFAAIALAFGLAAVIGAALRAKYI